MRDKEKKKQTKRLVSVFKKRKKKIILLEFNVFYKYNTYVFKSYNRLCQKQQQQKQKMWNCFHKREKNNY